MNQQLFSKVTKQTFKNKRVKFRQGKPVQVPYKRVWNKMHPKSKTCAMLCLLLQYKLQPRKPGRNHLCAQEQFPVRLHIFNAEKIYRIPNLQVF